MGNNEDGKSTKSEKASSPTPADQNNIHVYPDWATMQAYYGPRMAVPPYYNSGVASGHPPPPHPYMWGPPQPMMSPYGTPYAAIYSHGGVYPAVPMGSHPQAHGVLSSPATGAPVNTEGPTKSSANSERGLMKKLKGFDGLAMSIGNGNAQNAEGRAEERPSQSETEGSSEGSDENTSGAARTGRKRSREGTPTPSSDAKTEAHSSAVTVAEAKAASSNKMLIVAPGKSSAEPVISPGMNTALELRNTAGVNAKTTPVTAPQPCPVPPEVWLQNERELKRERRKQSNRESARRSRLRKQAETEELARKVESLNAENSALKSEVNQLTDKSEKLRAENALLLEKLKGAQLEHTPELVLNNNVDEKRATPISTENLLSRVNNNSGSVDRAGVVGEESHRFEKNSNNGAKLHQLLDTSPRADAVAAG